MRINEMHTEFAKLTDQFTLINSMTHPGAIANHFDAMHNLPLQFRQTPAPLPS